MTVEIALIMTIRGTYARGVKYLSILYSVVCENCKKELIFNAPHREDWICYFCGFVLNMPLDKKDNKELSE